MSYTSNVSFPLMLPMLSLLFAFKCWWLWARTEAQLSLVSLSTSVELSRISITDSRARRVLLCSCFGSMRAIQLASSRFVLNLSIVFQIVLVALTVYQCCGYIERAHMPFVVPDAVSFAMVSLTVFIFLLSFGLLFKEVHRSLTVWCGLLFILEGFILSAFLVKNILIFYISFESVLLPMYLFIGAWGSRSRKIKANYYFFLYTLFGSLFTLLGILALYFYTGALSYNLLAFTFNEIATIPNMRSYPLEHCIWLLLAIGFFAKFPIFVFHLWLPEAHVEAPTVGSVILAALLLKLGVYGFVRLPFTLFPVSTAFWLPIVLPFAFIGTLYPALVAIVHDDFKKIIAYSSISHMSFVLLGLLTRTFDGTAGALFLALGHGLTSGGLFVFAGLLYDRFRTRDVKYYGGVLSRMPYAGFSFVLLILGNTGFPFFCNFPGELLVFAGSIQCFGLVSGVLFFGFILTAIYSFRLVNLFFFGAPKPQVHNSLYDLTRSEFAILSVFNAAIVVLGLFCAPLLHLFEENLIWVL